MIDMKVKTETREQVTLIVDGQKVFGILHLPVDIHTKTVPAVLCCHGFGGNKSGRYRITVRTAERLAAQGIACLRIDFRGSGDSEGNFSDISISSQVEDALSALEFLKNHPQIDSKRIGILGRSLGGLVAVLVAAKNQTIKAMSLWAPVFDALPWFDTTKSTSTRPSHLIIDKSSNQVLFLGEVLNQKFLQELANLETIKELEKLSQVPLLHIYSENDKSVGHYHQEQYQLHTKGSLQSVILHASDHDFSERGEQETAIQETLNWFARYL